jgi:hypothetical protein
MNTVSSGKSPRNPSTVPIVYPAASKRWRLLSESTIYSLGFLKYNFRSDILTNIAGIIKNFKICKNSLWC